MSYKRSKQINVTHLFTEKKGTGEEKKEDT